VVGVPAWLRVNRRSTGAGLAHASMRLGAALVKFVFGVGGGQRGVAWLLAE
jgi:hypothetical protein